ncbi:hypothetical protein ABVN80_15925 [Acinetobacter baumannii]
MDIEQMGGSRAYVMLKLLFMQGNKVTVVCHRNHWRQAILLRESWLLCCVILMIFDENGIKEIFIPS